MIKKNTYNFTYVVHTHTHTTFSGFARVCEPNDVHICPVCLHSLIFTQDKLCLHQNSAKLDLFHYQLSCLEASGV